MSDPPNPPSRNDPKYRLRPSLEIAGPFSLRTELITGPRLTGVDHPENFGDPATGLDTANNANSTPIRTYAFGRLRPVTPHPGLLTSALRLLGHFGSLVLCSQDYRSRRGLKVRHSSSGVSRVPSACGA